MNNNEMESTGKAYDARRRRPEELPAADAEPPTDDDFDIGRPAKRHRGLNVTRSTTGLLDLPLSSLVEISHHLSILDGRKLVMTCKSLWTNRHQIESDKKTVMVESAAERQVLHGLLLRQPFVKLKTLDLGEWATDDFLTASD
jgi:hypothetical protein